MHRIFLAATAIVVLPAAPALAQTAAQPAVTDGKGGGGAEGTTSQPTPGHAATAHPDPDQAIVVTGVRRRADDVLGGVSVMMLSVPPEIWR
jgi:iron complex outermembrane receptor protein